ncbi:MAG TPA: nucleoside-diphosphate sugar epimerase/dehydratase [Opitutaceae bacterium]|nr:nucleoside-diphosphate sugar epimerase/dehydratase [Opitutaceae bacterium]
MSEDSHSSAPFVRVKGGTRFPFGTRPIVDPVQNGRMVVLAGIYSAIIAMSWFLAYELRFDFVVPESYQQQRLFLLAVVIGLKLGSLVAARQFGSMMTYFSVPDLLRLTWAMSGASLVLFLIRYLTPLEFTPPRAVLLSDYMLCLGGLCFGRLATRMFRERLNPHRKGPAQPQQKIVIVGAGDAGASLAREFIGSPSRGFRPVAFFDDDSSKHGKLVHGVPVYGRPEMVADSQDFDGVAKAVIAMPSATARRIREIVLLFSQRGMKVETLPSLEELASGRVRASRIRPVEVQDLLGREAVDLDSAAIRNHVENRVVLVTGAGGSIGAELCRQIAALNPKRLLMVEQAEGALFNTEQELNELGLGTIAVPLVADILDAERMNYIFGHYGPEIVFHAAAHKHVYLMERQPAEAFRNNVLGTRQLARLACAHGVEAFVFISTDKAINPTSVMGATKRLAEIQLMAIAAMQEREGEGGREKGEGSEVRGEGGRTMLGGELRAESLELGTKRLLDVEVAPRPGRGEAWATRRTRPTKFMAVRFGNVLGSSGSVIPIFKRQIANGGPVTVTHPDVTRYFMTIPEAVGLVLQSFVLGEGGEIFVLDMGQPVKIADLARQMIELSGFKVGDDIEIKFTGLKPGEKLFEELQHRTEAYTATSHPRIMRFTSGAMFSESGVKELEERLYALDSNEVKKMLQRLVPEYTPFLD